MYATKTRPANTIFDPDFDIYSRKENCLPSSNGQEPPFPGGLENSGGQNGHTPPQSTFPTGTTGGETIDPGTGTTAIDGDDKFTSTPNFPTTYHPNGQHGNRYPVTERYPPPPSGSAYDPYPSHRDPYNSGRPEVFGYGPTYSGGDGYYDNSPMPGNKYPSAARPAAGSYGDRDQQYNNNNYTPDNRYNPRPGPNDRNYPAPNYYPGPPSNSYSPSKYPPSNPSYSAGGGDSTESSSYGEANYNRRPSPTGGSWYTANEDSRYHKEKSDGNSYYGSRPTPPSPSYHRPSSSGSSSGSSYSNGGYYSGNSHSSYPQPPTSNKYPEQRPVRPERPSYGSSNSGESGGYQGQSSRPSNPLYPVGGGGSLSENNSYGSSANKYPEQKPIRPPPTNNPYQGGADPNRPDPTPVATASYPAQPQPTPSNNYGPTKPPASNSNYPNQSPPTDNYNSNGGYSDRDRDRNRPAPTNGPTNNNYYVTEETDKCK